MGIKEFLHEIKERKKELKDNNKPENYKPKFSEGDIVYNAKYNIVSKISSIRMYMINTYNDKHFKYGLEPGMKTPHYVMWDINNKNYKYYTPETKPKKRVRIAKPIDVYYQPASEAQKILFGKAEELGEWYDNKGWFKKEWIYS